ncbi:MAG: hypothetical protein IM542_12180 [Pseudanabaena sp. M165S2SP1A06QC]|nr:hypothetical protein [Pseudanabaena sp. M165S2SP1A06QC]
MMSALKTSTISLSLDEIANKIGAPDDIESLYHIARHLHANCKLLLEGDLAQPSSLKMMFLE